MWLTGSAQKKDLAGRRVDDQGRERAARRQPELRALLRPRDDRRPSQPTKALSSATRSTASPRPGSRSGGGGTQTVGQDLGVGQPEPGHVRVERRPRGPREVRVPAEPGGHRRAALVRQRHLDVQGGRGQREPLRRPVGPGPLPGRVAMLEDDLGLAPAAHGPGRPVAEPVDRMAAEVVRRQRDRLAAEREAPGADPVRPRHEREARQSPTGSPRVRASGRAGRRSSSPACSRRSRSGRASLRSRGEGDAERALRSVIDSMLGENTGPSPSRQADPVLA